METSRHWRVRKIDKEEWCGFMDFVFRDYVTEDQVRYNQSVVKWAGEDTIEAIYPIEDEE